ncbi:MAG: sodium:solute symporter family protein [Myxococcales bacterium]|nr:sodium:solute symporter family protein [Myxococcales bacterium]MCB9531741.1 sodium:solute symporter family protein [Myxococcales bacterium]MCB9534092.1 sodium:solute symporter family protein [Myxococcales bacterium]
MDPVAWGILGYVVLQLVVGFVVSRRVTTEEDYLLAGRSLGPVMATMSIFATWFGAETCIGAAAAVYEEGLSGAAADPFGYAACIFLVGLILAIPLARRRLTTLADLFRLRYGVAAERLAALLLAPTSLIWAAAQVKAFGHVLQATVPSLNLELGVTIAAAVVIAYTISGGLLADAVTDLVQGVVLIVGLVVVGVLVVVDSGGVAAAVGSVDPERLSLLHAAEEGGWLATAESWAVPICGSLVAQELIARVVAARSPEVARRACFAASGIYLAVGLIPVALGLLGVAQLPGLDDAEQVLPLMAREHLHTVAYVLFAGALVSAILSTVDTALLVAASLVTHNVVIPVFGVTEERMKLRLSRLGVLAFGLLAYAFAISERMGSVHDMVETASALGSSGIFVCTILGLFTAIGGRWAGLGALTAGIVVYVAAGSLEATAPFLASMAAAAAAFGVGAMFDSAAARRAQAV